MHEDTRTALQAGTVALLHQLARDLAEVRRLAGGTSGEEPMARAVLQAEWTATDLAILAALMADLDR